MKKLSLILIFTLNVTLLFAQKTDTIKRYVNGVMVLSSDDIIQSASQIKELSKFVSLLNYSGLSDTIKQIGVITLFAPGNIAITKLHGAIYDSLSKPQYKWQLANLLKCYIIKGRFNSKDLFALIRKNNGQAVLTTLSGSTLNVTINLNRNIVLTDMNGGQSIVSTFDIQQKNGILDIINSPLFPLEPPG